MITRMKATINTKSPLVLRNDMVRHIATPDLIAKRSANRVIFVFRSGLAIAVYLFRKRIFASKAWNEPSWRQKFQTKSRMRKQRGDLMGVAMQWEEHVKNTSGTRTVDLNDPKYFLRNYSDPIEKFNMFLKK